MEPQKDHLTVLNRHVEALEEKVEKLRASLEHWQKWLWDYAALQEEVENLPTEPEPRKELARIRRDFDGDVLTKKEINEIFGKNDLKEHKQILSVVSRRLDYVERNVESVQKLLDVEEKRLAAATVVVNPGGGLDEDTGLPITDIIERLDEDGNVVDYHLQTGADADPKIREALKKAGVGYASDDEPSDDEKPSVSEPQDMQSAEGENRAQLSESQPDAAAENSLPASSSEETNAQKKSVAFSEDTKEGVNVAQSSTSMQAQRLEQIMQTARDQESMDLSNAVIPDNESPEDSELRRQMLEYGMSEIGPVVAELELEDGQTDEDDLSYSDEEDLDEDDEDVNMFSPSTRGVITDDYVTRMKELEKKLGFKSAFTADSPKAKTELPEEGIGKISVVRGPESATPSSSEKKSTKKKSSEKKSVRFASELDIAEESSPTPVPSRQPAEPRINPLGDISERKPGGSTTVAQETETTTKRTSRFKKDRSINAGVPTPSNGTLPKGPHQVPLDLVGGKTAEILPVPSGPEGQTLASTVVERPVVSDPKEPDEMDDTLLYQAAAAEYNRLRNRLIQKQGGFTKPDESAIVPLDEEEGGPKRVSKFKAARLARLQ